MLKRFYSELILKYPKSVLLLLFLVVAFLGTQAFKMEVDASAETLLLENDKDLQFTRLISERYQTPDLLVIAYTPEDDLLSDKTRKEIKALSDELTKLPGVESVTSLLNVPLMQSPAKPLKEMLENIPTLESPDINQTMAKHELLNSPLYRNNLVSEDFKTTALMVNLKIDAQYRDLLKKRDALRQKKRDKTISSAEKVELRSVSKTFKLHRDMLRMVEHKNIEDIRAVMDGYRTHAALFLGGASMISDDMITYVKQDLKTYGIIVLFLLILVLWVLFRELHWVLLPVMIVTVSIISTIGLLGMFGWEVTVISSNFVSLQLIITMSIIIHLIVRYRELAIQESNATQHELVLSTVTSMAKPTFFAVITTIAGFTSLIFSNILPVINLGLMMSVGIAVSLLLTYLIFPAIVIMMPKYRPYTFFESKFSLTKLFATITERYGKLIIAISLAIVLFSLSGASKLMVENSFINYFKPSTEIYQGMAVIDQKLGGTTPLDIIIDFPPEAKTAPVQESQPSDDEFSEFDDFEEELSASENEAQYWFTAEKMKTVRKVHNYLESVPEVGKVLSLGTMLELGRSFNESKCMDNFQLALLYNELPEEFRSIILNPYISIENNQTRFSLRIIDSNEELRRDELLKRIKSDLVTKVGIPEQNVHLSNIMVLYNNMLQSLYSSQILTLGIMVLLLSVMFFVLFRSLKVAIIAMIANLIPISVIFGFMGWNGIPLDMMTITIAAISVGIAVDDTIHYIYRYKIEFAKDQDYIAAMHRSHESIGYAMTYTSAAIMIGFLVLVLSAFIPTIYFGLLTVLTMFMAIVADLLLLPKLILMVKPFGSKL
ncbi:MAG: MMPL family transporter [Sulfurimonadaceae bacterium]